MKKSHFTYKPSNEKTSVPVIPQPLVSGVRKSDTGSVHGTLPTTSQLHQVSFRNTSSPRTSSESHRHPAIELVPRSKDCPWISILGIFLGTLEVPSFAPIFFGWKEKLKCSLHDESLGGEKTVWVGWTVSSGHGVCQFRDFRKCSRFYVKPSNIIQLSFWNPQIWTKHKTYCTT